VAKGDAQKREANARALRAHCLERFEHFAGFPWQEKWEEALEKAFERWKDLEQIAAKHLGVIRTALAEAKAELEAHDEVVKRYSEYDPLLFPELVDQEDPLENERRFIPSRLDELKRLLGKNLELASSPPQTRGQVGSFRTFLVLRLLEATFEDQTELPEGLAALCRRLAEERGWKATDGAEEMDPDCGRVAFEGSAEAVAKPTRKRRCPPKHISTPEIAIISVLAGNVPGTKTLADYPKASELLREEQQAIRGAYGSILSGETRVIVSAAMAGFGVPPRRKRGL
jgi:hypothetical protein